jgi:hypothetical protein
MPGWILRQVPFRERNPRPATLDLELRTFMSIWLGIFIGSTIGGLIPELWDANVFSYTSVLFGGIGALAGLWIGLKLGN